MDVILAIDAGTTNLKVGVLDEKLCPVATAAKAMDVRVDREGKAEHDAEEFWQMVVEAVDEVRATCVCDVRMIVLSTYQFGLLLLDQDMKPLTGISLLSDTRARRTIGDFLAEFDADELYESTGCPALFQYPLARCYYLKRAHPEVWKKARFFCGSKDWLLWKLTGEFVSEYSVSAATQMMGLRSCAWEERILKQLGLGCEVLPRLVDGAKELFFLNTTAARELKLAEGLPVLPGYYDGGALCAGIDGLRGGVGVINTGTSAMLRAVSQCPALDGSPHKRLQCYALSQGRYLNGGGVNNAGLAVQWWNNRVTTVELEESELLGLARSAEELFVFPYLTGERDMLLGQTGSGLFLGLRTTHGAREMLYATMESVAFALAAIQEALGGNAPHIYRIAGGMTRSAVWCRLVASAINRVVQTIPESEGGLKGCAVLGWNKLGVRLTASVFESENTYEPESDLTKIIGEKYQRQKNLFTPLAELYRAAIRH